MKLLGGGKRMSRAFPRVLSRLPRFSLLLLLIVVSCFSSYLRVSQCEFYCVLLSFHISLYICEWQRAIGARWKLHQNGDEEKWQRKASLHIPSCFLLLLLFCCFPFCAVVVSLEGFSWMLQEIQELRPQKSGAQPAGFFSWIEFYFVSFFFGCFSNCTIFISLNHFPFSFAIDEIMISYSVLLSCFVHGRFSGLEWQMMSAPSSTCSCFSRFNHLTSNECCYL